MTKLEQYRSLNARYKTAVIELQSIQSQEDAKKKEIHDLLKQIIQVAEGLGE